MFENLFRVCDICGNKHGFKAGCCLECGWNYQHARFEFIRVRVDDLPTALRAPLTAKYAALLKK